MTLDDPDTSRPEELRLLRGTSVDRYVVLYELGVGGMGVVYAAYDPELDRKIALKLLHADSRGSRARTRLLREAKAIAKLTHPNVVTVHDVGTFEGRVFIAMEFVDGVTFRRWMQQDRRTWRDVVRILRQAGQGLAAAHAADLVHRDFKPDNVLVDAQGRVIVLDFGLARRASTGVSRSNDGSSGGDPIGPSPQEQDDETDIDSDAPADRVSDVLDIHLTRTGARIGTPAYMAPEQHLSAPTDARTDQFSFCVVLWEALFGARPFRGDSPTATAVQVVRGDIQEPPRNADVPARVRRVVAQGLAPNPDDRHESMHALLAALSLAPRRRLRSWGIVVGAGLVAGAAGWAIVDATVASPTPCQPEQAQQRWREVWDDAREEGMRRSFLATGLPYAEMTADAVGETFDAYADRWVAVYTEACRSTHVLKEQSGELLDLQMSCLRARRAQAGSLIDEFTRADAQVVQNAVEAALSLPALHTCEDLESLQGSMALPDDPATRQSVEDLRARLGEAHAKEASGRYGLALEVVRGVRSEASELDYAPIHADALIREASILERRGDYAAAEEKLLSAIWMAMAARHDDAMADAWVRLVWITGVERVQPDQGHLWGEFAAAAVRRLGQGELLDATLTHNLGGVLYRQGRLGEALEHYRRALKAQVALLGQDAPAVATTLNHIGNTLMEMGEFAAAREYCERSLDLRRRRLGGRHPKVAASLNNLAELYRKKKEPERSLEFVLESLEIVGGLGGPEEEIARVLGSDALGQLGRHDERVENDRRLLELRAAATEAEARTLRVQSGEPGEALSSDR